MLDFASASTRFDALPPAALDFAQACLTWLDANWDDAAGLICLHGENYCQPYVLDPARAAHNVRETAAYALGLLMRDSPGDRQRATAALAGVLAQQFDCPVAPFHGTFRRSPEEPDPPASGVQEWIDYDPNWREFIGTNLILILVDHSAALPEPLVAQIEAGLHLAATGAFARHLPAGYTNIALMDAFLLRFCGERFNEPAWSKKGDELAAAVYDLFRQHGAFDEYNSPTYYGIDFYGLALWRSCHGDTSWRAMGEEMEATLWRDVARFYHAGLRNVAGPFDRSYGMDMRRYASGLGMWIGLEVGRALAPFPDFGRPFDHQHDFCFVSLYVALGVSVPDDAAAHLRAFHGERQIEQTITSSPRRTATAWIGERLILGGEWADGAQRVWVQYHPGTAHWRVTSQDGGTVGTLRALPLTHLNVQAEKNRLTISLAEPQSPGTEAFRLHLVVPDIGMDAFREDAWSLPGVTIRPGSLTGLSLAAPVWQREQWVIACHATGGAGALQLDFEPRQI